MYSQKVKKVPFSAKRIKYRANRKLPGIKTIGVENGDADKIPKSSEKRHSKE